MKSETTIYKKWKMYIYGFGVILLVQSLMIPLFNMFLKEFVIQKFIHNMILGSVIGINIMVDIYFLYNRIYLTKRLLNKESIRCILEDIFLVPYTKDGKIRYAPYPIVRLEHSNELYLAYGKYNLVDFTAGFNYSNRKNIYCTLYKADGSSVRIGDVVDMYMLKRINVPVAINESKNTVKLKGKKHYFYHVNEKLDVNVFAEINFFKGIIDVDAGM